MLCLLMCVLCAMFLFFKQKTAYEMRISDWSSDVCSSDLADMAAVIGAQDGDNLAHRGSCEPQRQVDFLDRHQPLRSRKTNRRNSEGPASFSHDIDARIIDLSSQIFRRRLQRRRNLMEMLRALTATAGQLPYRALARKSVG